MIPRAVHRYPGIYLPAEENPRKLRWQSDEGCATSPRLKRVFLPSNDVCRIEQQVNKREEGKKKKKEKGITISDTRIGERNRNIKKYKNNHNCFVSCIFFGLFLFSWANNCPCKVICLYNWTELKQCNRSAAILLTVFRHHISISSCHLRLTVETNCRSYRVGRSGTNNSRLNL